MKLKKCTVHFSRFLDSDTREDVIIEARDESAARIFANVLFRGIPFTIFCSEKKRNTYLTLIK